ncbi:uncharacterized protein PgNI_00940 [Pyricularia grisea]|uniref:Uncharacterized protein n=1 Tax=Pyricularia grisea TaxID=148305 RepID=A0A6P8BLE3_PYRGI|nr:uncharacterized protein PgNI_00940 [Pyricularia grisea]TLD17475.1 hypothetical protein PgNI_00940 [Pyricularia grisea]
MVGAGHKPNLRSAVDVKWQETLDKQTCEKYNDCFARLIQQNYYSAARADSQRHAAYFPANADEIYKQIEAAKCRTAGYASQFSK